METKRIRSESAQSARAMSESSFTELLVLRAAKATPAEMRFYAVDPKHGDGGIYLEVILLDETEAAIRDVCQGMPCRRELLPIEDIYEAFTMLASSTDTTDSTITIGDDGSIEGPGLDLGDLIP